MTGTLRYAGFWRRFVAHVIDSIILNIAAYVVEVILLFFIYLGFKDRLGSPAASGLLGFLNAFNDLYVMYFNAGIYLCICFPYFVWGHFQYQTTVGKKLVRVRVVQQDGSKITLNQSITRWASYLLSYLPFCTGYLMAAFHPEKRALHDLVAGTVSVVAAD